MPHRNGPRGATATSLSPNPPSFTRRSPGVLIVVASGPDRGASVIVDMARPVVIGTAPECELVLKDSAVSRRHIQASCREDTVELADLGSKNGSFIGRARFERVEVTYGATFSAGDTTLKVLPNEAVLEPPARDAPNFGGLVGRSDAMRKLFSFIDQVAGSDTSVLIEGETGSGKEMVAEEIHRRSSRRDRLLGVIDCGAVPDELIESLLFGHVKGAFTGAAGSREGVFPESDGGTVFLDEIGELKLDLQPALLRVLDKGLVRPVGSTGYKQVNVRVVAASHRNLADMIANEQFREDLYYRLAVVRLTVPPLRDRPDDLPVLISHFLGRLKRPDLEIEETELARAREYPWPGNVRELRNAVERAVLFSVDGKLRLFDEDLAPRPTRRPVASPETPAPAEPPPLAAPVPPPEPVAEVLAPPPIATPEPPHPPTVTMIRPPVVAAPKPAVTPEPTAPPPSPASGASPRSFREAKAESIRNFEREYLTDLMRSHDSVTAAADTAEMDRKHLRMLLRRYDLIADE